MLYLVNIYSFRGVVEMWWYPWWWRPPWAVPPYEPTLTREEEIRMLESEKAVLEARLREIERRLKELKGES